VLGFYTLTLSCSIIYNGYIIRGLKMSDSIMVTTFSVDYINTFNGTEAYTGTDIKLPIGIIDSIIHVGNLWEVKFKPTAVTQLLHYYQKNTINKIRGV